jgi:hypothetical protein
MVISHKLRDWFAFALPKIMHLFRGVEKGNGKKGKCFDCKSIS